MVAVPNDELQWHLARRLYETMERLDPQPGAIVWDDMTEFERDFFRVCAVEVLNAADSWRQRGDYLVD